VRRDGSSDDIPCQVGYFTSEEKVQMLGKQTLVAFVATKNASAARKFYEQTLGLKVEYEDDYAIAFDAHGTTLRMQKVGGFKPQSFTTLGWEVSDMSAVVDGLAKRGVKFERYEGMDQDERGIWAAPSGAHVAWFKDPDGNTLSLTEA
jgi:catechol 2,3-dioxygenase-like lactoylglutathione lyase family enzyme